LREARQAVALARSLAIAERNSAPEDTLMEPWYKVVTPREEVRTAVISLPRSQVEMTDWDLQWQEKISKVVRRIAKDLIANDETEIGEVVRRLFENLGSERARKNTATAFAGWCFERRAQLPPEWTDQSHSRTCQSLERPHSSGIQDHQIEASMNSGTL